MPIAFTLTLDTKGAQLAIAAVRNGVPRAATRAINRTLTTVRADAARTVARDIGGVPVGQVRKAMEIVKARFRALHGRVLITGRRIPLIALRASGPEPSRGMGRGVSYSLGGRHRIRSAFITTLKSGHRGVFKRVLPSARRSPGAWGPNLPIIELHGPSIPRVAGKRTILDALKRLGQVTLVKNFDREVQFLMRTRRVPTGDE